MNAADISFLHFKTIPEYFMAILILQLFRLRFNSIKPSEKLSRQNFINSFFMSPKFLFKL